MLTVNYLAVLVAAVVHFGLGGLWYSPLLFGDKWAKLMGFDLSDKAKMKEMQKGMGASYFGMAVISLLMAYVLAHFVGYAQANTALAGAQTGFWAWLGFVATTHTANALWAKKNTTLLLIDVGYYAVGLIVMGIILALWK